MKKFRLCRFCEHLSPYESTYYDTTAVWMCYMNRDSCDKSIDSDACDNFEICDVIKEMNVYGNKNDAYNGNANK